MIRKLVTALLCSIGLSTLYSHPLDEKICAANQTFYYLNTVMRTIGVPKSPDKHKVHITTNYSSRGKLGGKVCCYHYDCADANQIEKFYVHIEDIFDIIQANCGRWLTDERSVRDQLSLAVLYSYVYGDVDIDVQCNVKTCAIQMRYATHNYTLYSCTKQ